MAKFLVNKLRESGLIGEITDMPSILHNLMIIGPAYKEGFLKQVKEASLPYIAQICVCGRFITYIEVSVDLKEGEMIFFDCKNDNDIALDNAALMNEKWFGNYYFKWFMEEFQKLKEFYSDNYEAAELLLVENAGLLLN